MAKNSPNKRRRIEAQGFVCFANDEIESLNYWLRFAPAICLIWTAIGVVLGSGSILAALVPFALLGGILTGHPFDVIYNHGIRHLTKTPELPLYGRPRRFACLMASVMISGAGVAFYLGYYAVGYALGSFLIVLAGVNVATGFCVPSFIYGLVFGVEECEAEELKNSEKKIESVSPLWPK